MQKISRKNRTDNKLINKHWNSILNTKLENTL